ncbi:type IV pilus assembly protein PilM [Candidatus Saccharibacteria bacterium]|nr:type IV pilus assembly protein PilM [Candidatus Saccharibacteria bacterium]
MKKTATNSYLFEDKPLFGLDIGRSTARVVQLSGSSTKQKPKVIGYGEIGFDTSVVIDGIIEKPQELASAIQKLFKHSLVGDITTRRVALSVPISHAFTRSIDLPKLNEKELAAAIHSEVEEYIPAASESLYVDYSTVQTGKETWATFIVAMPRRIVDSYMTVCRLLWLEPVIIQTSSGAGANLFGRDENGDLPSVLVDFGSESADITVFDKNPIVSGTVAFGGEEVTTLISKALEVNRREASIIKTKYGLSYSKKQKQIEAALKPSLEILIREIQRSIRYYEERSKGKRPIEQIAIMGGGANMPGLADYLTNTMRIPVRAFDPTHFMDFGHLQPLSVGERMSYVTAAGLATLNPEDAF